MKGLLYKDFRILLTSYKKNAVLLLFVYALLAATSDIPYTLYILMFAVGLYVISTLSFDEQCKWDCYVRTMPVSPEEVIGAKYLLGLCIFLPCAVICLVLSRILSADAPMEESLLTCAALTMVTLLYYSFSLPLSIRYGSVKGRTAVLLAAVCLGCLLVPFRQSMHVLPQMTFSPVLLSAVMLAVGALAYLISWRVSTVIYAKKEY